MKHIWFILMLLAGPVLAQTAVTSVAIEPKNPDGVLNLTVPLKSANFSGWTEYWGSNKASVDTFWIADSASQQDTSAVYETWAKAALVFYMTSKDSLNLADSMAVKIKIHPVLVVGSTAYVQAAVDSASYIDAGPHIWTLDSIIVNKDYNFMSHFVLIMAGGANNGHTTRVRDAYLWRNRHAWLPRE